MSNNNHIQPALPTENPGTNLTSRLFVAKYDSQIVAIRRNPDFAATVASIRRVFPELQSLHPSCIRISAKLPGFGDFLIQLHAEIWAEVLPALMFTEISTGDNIQQEVVEPIEILASERVEETTSRNPDVNPEPLTFWVQDTHGNIKDLYLALVSTSTVRQLKDLIIRHNNRLPHHLHLSYGEYPTLEDHKQLYEYGIQNDVSIVKLTTEFKIYLVGPDLSRHPVNIVTFANISALRILYLNLVEDCSSSSDFYAYKRPSVGHVVSCDGEVLDETQSLGSFKHLAPECEICVNEVMDSTSSHADYRQTTIISIHESTNPWPLLLKCRVFPESTILDLKVLISNKLQTPSSRQARKFELNTAATGTSASDCLSPWHTVQSYCLGSYTTYLRDHPN